MQDLHLFHNSWLPRFSSTWRQKQDCYWMCNSYIRTSKGGSCNEQINTVVVVHSKMTRSLSARLGNWIHISLYNTAAFVYLGQCRWVAFIWGQRSFKGSVSSRKYGKRTMHWVNEYVHMDRACKSKCAHKVIVTRSSWNQSFHQNSSHEPTSVHEMQDEKESLTYLHCCAQLFGYK